MRTYKHIQGKSVDEQIASIDSVLASLSRRSNPNIARHSTDIPCAVFIKESEEARTFFTIPGRIRNIAIDVAGCEKDTKLVMSLVSETETVTKRIDVKKGLNKIEHKFDIDAYTQIILSFSLPVTTAMIGFTFINRRDRDEAETVST